MGRWVGRGVKEEGKGKKEEKGEGRRGSFCGGVGYGITDFVVSVDFFFLFVNIHVAPTALRRETLSKRKT